MKDEHIKRIKHILGDKWHEHKRLFELTPKEWRKQARHETRINKYKLDDDVAGQSSLYMKWAGYESSAEVVLFMVVDHIEREKGRIDLSVRKTPSNYGLEDIKETAVKSIVNRDWKLRVLRKCYFLCYELHKTFKSAVTGFEHRKLMLREEGELWLGQYYSKVEIKESSIDRFRSKTAKSRRRK